MNIGLTNTESLSMNGLSMKSLNTIMIEPAVNDALTKFIHCAAHKDVHSKLMISTGLLVMVTSIC